MPGLGLARLATAHALVLGLALAVLAFGIAGSAQATPRSNGCQTRCFQQKSFDYQNCRMIPPSKREARNACFIRADSALQRCLRGC